MKTKIVYVLVSTDDDIYLEQALLSIYSLRQHTPNANIVVITDNITEQTICGNRSQLRDHIDELIVLSRPEGISAKESAYSIKTRVRSIVSGDYLFIDTDTIINSDLSTIDDCPYDIAAVPDAHTTFENHFGRIGYIRLFKKLKFTHQHKLYFNSGVLFVRDTPVAHELYRRWEQSYHTKITDCFYDQPHLAFANNELNVISELDGIWNCQVQFGIRHMSKSKIIHYFASNFMNNQQDHPYLFMEEDIFKQIKSKGGIDLHIQEMVKSATEQWADMVEVVAGQEIELLHSKLLKVIRYIYYNHRKTYNLIEQLLYKLSKFK